MTEINEHTFIKQSVKTFWAVIYSAMSGAVIAACLYFGLKDAIKDIKNEMVSNIKDIRFERTLDSLKRANDYKAQINIDAFQNYRLRKLEQK